MKNFIYKIILLWVVIISGNLYAQSYFDIINIGYEHSEYFPKNTSSFAFDRFQARINVGVELKNEDYILGTYSGEIFKFQNIEYTGKELNLYSNFITAGYLHFWKDKEWSLLTQVRFKLNSDYHQTSVNDIQTGSWFMFTYKSNDKLSLFGGMYFNQEIDKNLIFPIGGIHWIPDEKWNLYVLIPSIIRLEWILKENSWYTGLESDWNLNTYLIKENPDIKYFRKESLVSSIFIEKHISEKFVLYLKIGNYQINDYQAFNNSGELIPQTQFDSGLLRNFNFQTGLAYRVRL